MRIGIIGIGAMGWGVARAFMRGPHEVLVRDIRDEANEIAELGGAIVCDSPATLARDSDAVITFVVDGAQTEDVLFGAHGAAETLRPGQPVLLCSTMGVDEVVRIGAQLSARGVPVLDTPVSGGPDRAREGQLTMMAACKREALELARPVFDYMARDVFHISEDHRRRRARQARQQHARRHQSDRDRRSAVVRRQTRPRSVDAVRCGAAQLRSELDR